MNLLSFNKTNPNLTVIPFKENKCTSLETQPVKKEERKRKRKRKLPRCEEGRKKKGKKRERVT